MMRKAFKYRLYPTRQQSDALAKTLETHRRLYNNALAERKTAWESEKRYVCYGDQSARLKVARQTDPFLAQTNFSSPQATLRRLDRAFQAFFRRLKAGGKPGYPRFKGTNRFDTVEFPSHGDGCQFHGSRVYFQHIGQVKVKLHRPIEGTIKTLSFKREADGWHLIVSCDLEETPVSPSANPAVGIDLGLKAFLATSDGETIEAPRAYQKAQRALRRAQRHLSRCQKGSNRRRKALQRLARLHQRIANQRRDFQHKLARKLVTQYGVVVHEDLNIRGIARTRLAKSTYDAGWGQFLAILRPKAEEAGVQVIPVPPHNTSQACSACGCLPDIPKALANRLHICPHCGYTADRDVNAARNILRLGLSRQTPTVPSGAVV